MGYIHLLSLGLVWSVLAQAVSFRALPGSPADIRIPSLGNPASRRVHDLELPTLNVQELVDGELRLTLPGGRNLVTEGLPEVPYLVRTFALPSGMTARATLRDLQVERSEGAVPLPKGERPYVWSPDGRQMDFLTPHRGRYFPGKFVDSEEVDGKLVVTIYPVQVDRQTGEILRLKGGRLELGFEPTKRVVYLPSYQGPESLIVTAKSLEKGATLLQRYHRNALGMESRILFVEELAGEPLVEESGLPDGYKNRNLAQKEIDGRYDYALARRLIHYLRRQMADGKALRYVTLLGDSRLVPPSYYISVRSNFGPEFAVTDMCYAADDGCLRPKLAVGRLPFSRPGEVEAYLAKVDRWLRAPLGGTELSLYGGKAFRGYHYIGELGTLRLIPGPEANWRGIEKYHRTRGNYDTAAVEAMVSGRRESPFVYYLDHGKGNQWWVERRFVSSKDILEASPGSGRNPFVVSLSCVNAAFDRPLIKDASVFGPSEHGDVAVGVALLKARAGAVAYLGSGRPAIGNPVYTIDKEGNLNLTGSTYAMQILETFLWGYHQKAQGRAGDLLREALRSYVFTSGHDLTDDRHKWSYFNLVFLGDPVLMLPPRRAFGRSQALAWSTTVFPRVGGGLPFPGFESGEGPLERFPFKLRTAESMEGTLYRVDRFRDMETVLNRQQGKPEEVSWDFEVKSEEAPGSYFWKLENRDELPVERRVWFHVNKRPPVASE